MPADPTFSYSTAPLPVKPSGGRRKYREDEAHLTLMSDPRVVRGSVSGALKKHTVGSSQEINKTRLPGSRKANTSNLQQSEDPPLIQPTFFFNVDPVVDPNIDLRSYLEEDLSQLKPVSKLAVTQTDEFNERPDTPEYVPRKTGIDRSTQVEKLSDLFIFDEEVEPMLHVIVSKTLEQALFEIEREEELKNLEQECERFRRLKVEDLEWVKKREQESVADAVVKDLALKGMKEKQSAENEVRAKVASRRAIVQLLPSMVDEVTSRLFADGVWKDPNRVHLSEVHLPEIYKAAAARAQLHDQVIDIIDGELLRYFIVWPPADELRCRYIIRCE
jgi:radial spoke head protein 3